MPVLLEFNTENGSILVDVTQPGNVAHSPGADGVVKKAQDRFEDVVKMATAVSASFRRLLHESSVEKAELDMGFQFTSRGTAYLVQSEAQVALKVRVVLRREGRPGE